MQLATMQELARYWAGDYDWRRAEAKLDALPRFRTEIGGVAYPTLGYFHEAERGGHFAAWEEPERFTTESRAAFRALRGPRIPEPRR